MLFQSNSRLQKKRGGPEFEQAAKATPLKDSQTMHSEVPEVRPEAIQGLTLINSA